jgi:serine-type D-Ala-D-Ala carboxypeptidase/endopeptidase (penicillin-binding protein 4)
MGGFRSPFMGQTAYLRPVGGPPCLTVRRPVANNARMPRRRLAVLFAAALVVASCVYPASAADGTLAKRLARALAVPHVVRASSGALAFDLTTGTTIFTRNEGRSLAPASNEKLLVSYAALVTLGPEYLIETDVLGRGELVGTTWRGDLILQGHGDPTLSSADLVALARSVRAAGIRLVAGAVIGDESYFDARRTAPGWKSSFYINESPPLSALSVDRGRYAGRIAVKPALAAALSFRLALRRAGVAVSGGTGTGRAGPDALPLADVTSPPLAAIIRFMDRTSDNFTAELLLKQLSAAGDGIGTSAGGAAVVRTALASAGVPLRGVRVVDGSGLSRLDRVTPRALVGVLRAAWENPEIRGPFLSSLAIAGVNGTLEDRMRRPPARGNVLAKTGTTSIASALSGYVKRRFIFSVIQNGRPVSTWWARRAQDRFATVLAAAQ